ncbi:MAG: metallophosphoesterase [Chthoniobacteraceae bacterium]
MTSRRRFLRQTFAFSALAAAGWRRHALGAPVDPAAQHILMLGDWGADNKIADQTRVAKAMAAYAQAQRIKPGALLMLGDNFYGKVNGGVSDPRWQTQFEQMYPQSAFDCPCYAILGNHDYYVEPASKPDDQLAYAAKGGTRWTMPAKWYRFEFPKVNPLVTFLALDSNYQKSDEKKQALTDAEKAAQLAWLKAELAKPHAPFVVALGHHPLYSNGQHGDTKPLLEAWEPIFRQHKVHLYLCGHDHDMQHLEFDGHPTSFAISGGGGAGVRELKQDPKKRGPFGQKIHGFSHLEMSAGSLVLRHLGADGRALHAFSKTPAGRVTVL